MPNNTEGRLRGVAARLAGLTTVGAILLSTAVLPGRAATPGAPGLLSQSVSPDANDIFAKVATSSSGVWLAAWNTNDDGAGGLSDYDIFVRRSTDAGATWSTGVRISDFSTFDGDDSDPEFATDGSGNWVIVWGSSSREDLYGSDRDIMYATSTDDGISWSQPGIVNNYADSDSGTDGSSPDGVHVAFGSGGEILVAWSTNSDYAGTGTDYDTFACRSTDFGSTWSDPVAVWSGATTDTGNDFIVDSAARPGVWLLSVTIVANPEMGFGSDRDVVCLRTLDDGQTWQAPTLINNHGASDGVSDDDASGRIDCDPVAGICMGVWRSRYSPAGHDWGPDNDILCAISTDGGATWSDAVLVNQFGATDSADDIFPDVSASSTGEWLVTWDSDSTEGGSNGDHDIRFATSLDDGNGWTFPGFLHDFGVADTALDYLGRIAAGNAGGWIVLSSTSQPLDPTSNGFDAIHVEVMGTAPSTAGPLPSARPALTLVAYPNPAVAEVRLELTTDVAMTSHGAPEFFVFDVNGRLHAKLGHGTEARGQHLIVWVPDERRTRRGVYFAVASTDLGTAVARLTLVE